MHVGLAAEPGELALGVVAVALLGFGKGDFFAYAFDEERQCLAISERVKRLDSTVAGEESTGLLNESRCKHRSTPFIQALIKCGAMRIEADAQKAETGERVAGEDTARENR